MMWIPVLVILSLLNSLAIAKKNDDKEKPANSQIYNIFEEDELPEDNWKSWKYDHNSYSKYMPKYKDSHHKTRDIESTEDLNARKIRQAGYEKIVTGDSATNSMNGSTSISVNVYAETDTKNVTDSTPNVYTTLYDSTVASTSEPHERTCSGQRCSSLGGNCIERGNTTCLSDICGKRSFLSPCNCDKDHCCCMPVTCPPDPSSENYQRCNQAGGYCLYRDQVCDGECLPLCGPSCTCCIAACSDPGKRCGKNNQGKCKIKCDKEKGEMEYPLEQCAGPNCRCCGPKKIDFFGVLPVARKGDMKYYQRAEVCDDAIFGTPCEDGAGIYKKKCEIGESVIEYITPLCKCCAKEVCPMAGEFCDESRGICKKKCAANEVEVKGSTCGDGPGCSCCVAKTCTDLGKVCLGNMNRTGECAPQCKPDHEPIGLCPGNFGLCLCCAPQVCAISVGSVCPSAINDPKKHNSSVCKPECDSHEKESGICPGPACKCCTSSICEEPGVECSNGRGSCKPSCADNEQIDGTCHGSHCFCCIPKPCDNLWGSCGKGGVCKTQCLDNEKSTPGCSGWNCTCCVPMKCLEPMGHCGNDKKGFCKNSCDAKEIHDMTTTCNGVDCSCCREKDCHFEGRTCLNGTGKCRANCLRTEEVKEDRFACTGLNCKCCVLKDCIGMDTPCGVGLAGRCRTSCKEGSEDDVGRCEGQKCRCCREKDCKRNGCSCGGKLGGTCKPQCDVNEEAISKCDGRDCSCCIKRFCESFDRPCGGNMNGQCKHTCTGTEIPVGQCAGVDCKCCALQSCAQLESTCGHSGRGRCRPVCYKTEEVVGTCAGTNCSCCQHRMCNDPGSCCNKVSADGKEIAGTCKHRCSEGEEMISQCDGFDCKCCSPKKCMHFGSPCGIDESKGICKDECSIEEEVIGKCKGSDCKCCALKVCQNEGAMCRSDGFSEVFGKCMHTCKANQEEIGLCAGAHCKCCANKPCDEYGITCGNNGVCRDRCLSAEDPTGKCKGTHCICCEPKVICPELGPEGCSPSGGVCQRDCTDDELAPNATAGACGSECKCCICKASAMTDEPTSIVSDYDEIPTDLSPHDPDNSTNGVLFNLSIQTAEPCVHDGGPCGNNNGTCREKCLPLEVSGGKCRGANCHCCEPNKDATNAGGITEGDLNPDFLATTAVATGDGGLTEGKHESVYLPSTAGATDDGVLTEGKHEPIYLPTAAVAYDDGGFPEGKHESGDLPTTEEVDNNNSSTQGISSSISVAEANESTYEEINENTAHTPATYNMLTISPEPEAEEYVNTFDENNFDDYPVKDSQYSGEYYHAGHGYDQDGYATIEPTN